MTVTARRTRLDFARAVRDLVDVHYPAAERIVPVLDNPNTHHPASRYLAFPPAEAKRLWDRLEIHHTPKHGSWLNVAEIELSVLGRQCLDRRIPERAELAEEVAAWVAKRNAAAATVDWQFTTADARTKLNTSTPPFYPSHELARGTRGAFIGHLDPIDNKAAAIQKQPRSSYCRELRAAIIVLQPEAGSSGREYLAPGRAGWSAARW